MRYKRRNIRYRNIDIIHCGRTGYSTFQVHNGHRALQLKMYCLRISGLKDLKEGWLIDFRILESDIQKIKAWEYVDNVRFKNINVQSDFYPFS